MVAHRREESTPYLSLFWWGFEGGSRRNRENKNPIAVNLSSLFPVAGVVNNSPDACWPVLPDTKEKAFRVQQPF